MTSSRLWQRPSSKVKPFRPSIGIIGHIRFIRGGTFGLREFPPEIPIDKTAASSYVVDRWTPLADADRDMISQFPETKGTWYQVGNVWFGFEDEAQIWTNHNKEYYNLIVIRPSTANSQKSLMKVSEYLSNSKPLWFG